MDSPKCKICGDRHYGLCEKAAVLSPAPAKLRNKPLLVHQEMWLSDRPGRSRDWLRKQLSDGFHIHHLDGDHSNNDPRNLILIEKSDHARLHRKIMPVLRATGETFDRNAYQREYMRKRRAAAKAAKERL